MKNKARKKLSGKFVHFEIFLFKLFFSAMVSALDSAVGDIVASLKTFNMYDNSIIVFTADVSEKIS